MMDKVIAEYRLNRTLDKKTRVFNGETFRMDALGITPGEQQAVKDRRKMRISDGYKTRLVKYAGNPGALGLFIKLRKA